MVATNERQVNRSVRLLANHLDQKLQPLYPAFGALSRNGAPRLQFESQTGWTVDGLPQGSNLPTAPSAPKKPRKRRSWTRRKKSQKEPSRGSKKPMHFLNAAQTVLATPKVSNGLQGTHPEAGQIASLRDAFVNRWLDKNDFLFSAALRFDESHWLSDMVRYTQSQSVVSSLEDSRAALYLPKFRNSIKSGKILRKDVEDIRRMVQQYEDGTISRANRFRVWLWGYRDLLKYYDAHILTQKCEAALTAYQTEEGSDQSIRPESTSQQANPILNSKDALQRYDDQYIEGFKQFSDQMLAEVRADLLNNTGFKHIAPTLKAMVDQYKYRLLNELSAQGSDDLKDDILNLVQKVNDIYDSAESEWLALSNLENAKSLSQYREAVFSPFYDLTESEYAAQQLPDFECVRDVIEGNTLDNAIPDVNNEHVVAMGRQIQQKALDTLAEFKARFELLDRMCGEQKRTMIKSCEKAFDGYKESLKSGKSDAKVARTYMKTALQDIKSNMMNLGELTEIEESRCSALLDELTVERNAWSAKLEVLILTADAVQAYATKCDAIATGLEQQTSGEFSYMGALGALQAIPLPDIEDADASTRSHILEVSQAIRFNATERINYFADGFAETLKEFTDQIEVSLHMLDPNINSANLDVQANIPKLYQDLVKDYALDEDSLARMGKHARAFCQHRLDTIRTTYVAWQKMAEKSPYLAPMRDAFNERVKSLSTSTELQSDDVEALQIHLAQLAGDINQNKAIPDQVLPIVEMLKKHYVEEYKFLRDVCRQRLAVESVQQKVRKNADSSDASNEPLEPIMAAANGAR